MLRGLINVILVPLDHIRILGLHFVLNVQLEHFLIKVVLYVLLAQKVIMLLLKEILSVLVVQ